MIAQFTTVEKELVIKNAISSFVHGIEHLLNYKEGKNIKFSILHIFNALELLLKAYIGSVNIALLRPNIDRHHEKIADISILLERMKDFSEVQFNESLIKDIEILRKKRNEIEHKEFSLADQKVVYDLMTILVKVISELIIFSHKNLDKDLKQELPSELENKFNDLRLEFDEKFSIAIEKLKTKGIGNLERCTKCFNFTVPFVEKECKVSCFYCNELHYILQCGCERYGLSDFADIQFHCNRCITHLYEEQNEFKEDFEESVRVFSEELPKLHS